MLTIHDHRRDSARMRYVYPVVSRRAGGVSVGVNLNVNNACNWACLYCQVPELTRGGPPPVDVGLLETELRRFLDAAIHGDFLACNVPEGSRRLMDVAFSGNGEPTSSPEFFDAVSCVARVLGEMGLLGALTIRLLTNGSLMHRVRVREAVAAIGAHGGEVWFKVDRATAAGMAKVNDIRRSPEALAKALSHCADAAPTWVQTCWLAVDGAEASENERAAYLELLSSLREKIKGVHLYGLARPSMQTGASRVSNLPPERLQNLARQIVELGLQVVVNP